MERILIFIKHHIRFLWNFIEWVNGILFFILYKTKMESVVEGVFQDFTYTPLQHRKLILSDIEALHDLIKSQKISDLEYFKPHDFDLVSIRNQFENPSFLMMGTFDGTKMAGYFFLRFFVNSKCFVGRLIDQSYRGKGIGADMNNIMYEIAWRMKFRCLSTISRNNTSVMRSHAGNKSMVILKELQNNYLLVEFIRNISHK